jgi:hypothetical protein
MGAENIITTGQLGSSSATLQAGGGALGIRLHNTHTSSLAVVLTVARGTATARTLWSGSIDASGALTVSGLALGADDVLAGYAATGSKVDYLIMTCPETVPLEIKAYDSSGSIKSGGSAYSPVDVAATGRITTRDSVASGTDRIVGGLVKAGISTSDTVTAATSNNSFTSFATTCVLPANTLKAGTVVKVRVMVSVADASGSDTLTCNILLGSTSLIATTAVNPGATTDLHILDFELTSREAPGGTSAIVGSGRWITNTGGTIAHGTGLLASSTFATNGALTISSQAKWSSNTANTSARLESFTVEVVG